MFKESKIAEEICTRIDLRESTWKLRWYLKHHTDWYKDIKTKHELDLLVDQFDKVAKDFKKSYLLRGQILKVAKSKLVHPIEVLSGVYFLIDTKSSDQESAKIIYIGSAKNILNRLSGHFYKEHKTFDKLHYQVVKESEIRHVEGVYIWLLGYPKENKNAGENDYLVRNLVRNVLTVRGEVITIDEETRED